MAPGYVDKTYDLTCRSCGGKGMLSITGVQSGGDWSMAPVGFVGLAVDHHNPSNSVMRCVVCGSSDVAIGVAT